MKNVLLLVHDDTGQEARLQVALDIVRAIRGHLICLDLTIFPVMAETYHAATGVPLAEQRKRATAHRYRIEDRLALEGLSWHWVEDTGKFALCLKDTVALADLIVVNRKLRSFPVANMRGAAGEIILQSGTPLIAVPEVARSLDMFGDVLIAWDGSQEAIAALRAAVPLLKMARQVTILEIADGSVRVSGDEAAAYLSSQNINAMSRIKHRRLDSTASEILRETVLRSPTYVGMGGYAHGRLKDARLGVCTRRMLTESPVPVFFAH